MNDVTDTLSPATAAPSRNAMILAEWEAKRERSAEYRRLNPKAAERLDALAAAVDGGNATEEELAEEERLARWLAAHLTDCSYGCSTCRAEFSEGDVVHRRRVQLEADFKSHWGLSAVCAKCVQTCMHPSWFEHRSRPEPCAGGCGVLVSHWYSWQKIRTCSTRCSERMEAGRRRVQRETGRCAGCKEEFTTKRADARYCGPACRQRAYRDRLAGSSGAA